MRLRSFEVAANFGYSLTRINCRFLVLIKRFQPLSNDFLKLGRNGTFCLFFCAFHGSSIFPNVISPVDICKRVANISRHEA
jgi:hypothetical protein